MGYLTRSLHWIFGLLPLVAAVAASGDSAGKVGPAVPAAVTRA
jgi:hypothetical protein